jgi:hypothetical protein
MKVALVCIAKNEDPYIDEWVSYHLKLGFDKIFVYENNWRFSGDNHNDSVIKIPFDGECKQMESYHNFIRTFGQEYDWAAFFDVDEFLVLKKHKNIQEFIGEYNEYDCVSINWVLFGDNGLDSVQNDDYSVLNRFTKRQIGVDQHVKTILNLRSHNPIFHTPHSPSNLTWVDTNHQKGGGPLNSNGDDSIAQINHYFCKTKEEFISKISRGRSDIGTFRTIDDFIPHNHNSIEDLTAFKFYNS